MARRLKASLIVLLLSWHSFSLAGQNINNGVDLVDVRFKPGTSSASYLGTVRGYGYTDFVFYATAGQTLAINLDDDILGNTNTLEPMLFNRHFEDTVHLKSSDSQGYVLPYDGRYRLRVLQMRIFARRGNVNNFSLNISISNRL
ncbi:hypothetical protein CS022_02375 [Veronia nyctiphanis]|uniref:Inhibitor of g-type lysozyme n=1 Tax=Veronia nyctiphanis TaxID=1278244 RepID=A0A4Q0YZA4_9GAMM|nr:hypothetical protein [Veronia nyctiphanis]RXJ74461.1 hypothetical protein CS022_02375 [Veronia nyctiphanis]